MMNTSINRIERKIQVVDFPKIPHTIKKYDNFHSPMIKQKKKVKRTINRSELVGMERHYIKRALAYSVLVLCGFMVIMFSMYSLSSMDIKKESLTQKLSESKRELELLQGINISNFDLKTVEIKSKELGFVPNNEIKYIDVTN